ncbi:hypothetical protein YC2023_010356 [Brassica napus]
MVSASRVQTLHPPAVRVLRKGLQLKRTQISDVFTSADGAALLTVFVSNSIVEFVGGLGSSFRMGRTTMGCTYLPFGTPTRLCRRCSRALSQVATASDLPQEVWLVSGGEAMVGRRFIRVVTSSFVVTSLEFPLFAILADGRRQMPKCEFGWLIKK